MAEAAALASGLPEDRPGDLVAEPAFSPEAHDWSPRNDTAAADLERVGRGPPPLPDFSRLELVALEPEGGHAMVKGAVLVVAGVGGPDAVRKLITALPSDFSRPLLVQLKLDGGRYDNLVKQLARVSALPVAMAMPGDALSQATIYVLPERVGIEVGTTAWCSSTAAASRSKPCRRRKARSSSSAEPSRRAWMPCWPGDPWRLRGRAGA